MSYTVYRRPDNTFRLVSGLMIHILLSRLGIKTGKEEARQVYEDQFSTKANARSSKRMVRETVYWGKGDTLSGSSADLRNPRVFYRFIQDNITRAWGPDGRNIGVRALIGRWDPLGKDGVISQWLHHLPQMDGHVQIFEKVGHFVNIEKSEKIADAVLDVAGLR